MYFYASIGNSDFFFSFKKVLSDIPQVFLSILLSSRKDTFESTELKVLLNYEDPKCYVNSLRPRS